MSRQKIVAGNWKMNKNFDEGLSLAQSLLQDAPDNGTTVILGTPYIHLKAVGDMLKGSSFMHLAAQNCHEEEKGAYTGEISVDMIRSVGADYVILGHSERRAYFKEDNALLAAKVNQVLGASLRPIF
ncbi:MAG: triose-phosphate isomerase, partial [Bacteroidota bacterium]